MSARSDLFSTLYNDRVLAHAWLFERRHSHRMPDFAPAMIGDYHSQAKYGTDIVFRGGMKSTTAEEAICIRAGFREFRYCIVLGDTIDRAIQRLHAIRFEMETNERFQAVFGDLQGRLWSADQLWLSSDIMIQALGKGQSMRGMKFLDARPDFFFADDLEDYPDVKTEKLRDATYKWFTATFLPACEPDHRGRMAANMLDEDCLAMRLKTYNEWPTRVIPIMHPDGEGRMVSSWPGRFPLSREDARAIGASPESCLEDVMAGHQRAGTLAFFNREYMCRADSTKEAPFKREMFKVEPRVKTWQPAMAMFDPARTVGLASSLTGYASWSWIGHKLVVWDCWAKPLLPDEIVRAVFELHGQPGADGYKFCEPIMPVLTGFEQDGLHEWAMQPIRAEQARRHAMIPVRALKAPKGKLDFIRSLQIYFNAREVEFAKPLPDLEGALLSFPAGKQDAPNALAYAPLMRGGAPMYAEFEARHVALDITPSLVAPCFLALNATSTILTAALVQMLDGAIRVFGDWIVEGDPAVELERVVSAAQLVAAARPRLAAPPQHFERYSQVGLTQAAGRLGREIQRFPDPARGRRVIREALERSIRGAPALMVGDEARWTLNAFTGGYRMMTTRQGLLADVAEEGPYRVLMEGLESFAAMADVESSTDDDDGDNYAVTPSGVRYRSILPARR